MLAKSVGWGWLSYHAFIAGYRLSGFVPPILGLRNGILYMEWVPTQEVIDSGTIQRRQLIDRSAHYVAARTWHLMLGKQLPTRKPIQRHQTGLRLLANSLAGAYGRLLARSLMLSRVRKVL